MNDTNRKLLSIVLDKTNKKLLTWSRGSSNNEFKVELNSATLHISHSYIESFNPVDPTEAFSVYMYNGTGAAITLASETDRERDFAMLLELYCAAKDSCTKESETIDNLIKELSELGQ